MFPILKPLHFLPNPLWEALGVFKGVTRHQLWDLCPSSIKFSQKRANLPKFGHISNLEANGGGKQSVTASIGVGKVFTIQLGVKPPKMESDGD